MKSLGKVLEYAPCSLVRKKHPCEPQWFVKKHQSLVGMSVLQQTVSLAAQPRAFSSLLSLPSQAQSVIKAFRRQGIGSADEFNTARFLLSRLESLSAAPTSLSFLRFRSKSSKSSEGGQSWPHRAQWRDCVIYSVPHTLYSINPTDSPKHASRSWPLSFLV